VHDMRRGAGKPPAKSRERDTIRRARIAPDRRGFESEAQAARNCRERLIDARGKSVAVEEHADVVATRRLLAGEIDHMSEQSAERRPEDVYDPEFAARVVGKIRRQWFIRILPVAIPEISIDPRELKTVP
jgi:hypothetical protein